MDAAGDMDLSRHQVDANGLDAGDLVDASFDAALVNTPVRCIEDWPQSRNASVKPSLQNVGTPRVLWRKKLPWLGLRSGIVLSAGHLAFTGGNKLWILDLAGNVTGQLLDASSPSGQAPIADRDGNFYFTTSSVYSVKPDGSIRWQHPLGVDLSGLQEATYTSRILLSPHDVIYFAASDGLLYALQTSDGATVWTKPDGLSGEGDVRYVDTGTGDTFFVDKIPYIAGTGEVSIPPNI